MIKRRNLRTQNIKMFILDEADEMLNRGLLRTHVPSQLCLQGPRQGNVIFLFAAQDFRSKSTTCTGTYPQPHKYVLCVCVCVCVCVNGRRGEGVPVCVSW